MNVILDVLCKQSPDETEEEVSDRMYRTYRTRRGTSLLNILSIPFILSNKKYLSLLPAESPDETEEEVSDRMYRTYRTRRSTSLLNILSILFILSKKNTCGSFQPRVGRDGRRSFRQDVQDKTIYVSPEHPVNPVYPV
jgi:hypothetical protein